MLSCFFFVLWLRCASQHFFLHPLQFFIMRVAVVSRGGAASRSPMLADIRYSTAVSSASSICVMRRSQHVARNGGTTPVGWNPHNQQQHRNFSLSQTIAQLWLVPLTYRPHVEGVDLATLTSGYNGGGVFVEGGSLAFFGLGLTDPSCILFGCGVLARLSTLLFCSLYGDRSLSRFACALPELHTAFRNYLSVADHPKSIGWERRVAKNKLTRERKRVFALHGTGTMRTFLPHLVGACLFIYYAYGPAASVASAAPLTDPLIPIGRIFIPDDGVKVDEAASAARSPLKETLSLLDGALVAAAGISGYNIYQAILRRKGFNNQLDRRVRIVSNYVRMGCVPAAVVLGYGVPLVAASIATLIPSLVAAGPAPFFFSPFVPAYLPSFWLGASITGLLQHPFNNAEPLRQILDIPARPPTHGTYGNSATGAMIDAMDSEMSSSTTSSAGAAQLLDEQERLDQWKKHKMLLDYESTLKIYQFLKRLGIRDDDDDIARDMDLLTMKVERARELRDEENAKIQAQRIAEQAAGHSPSNPIHKEG